MALPIIAACGSAPAPARSLVVPIAAAPAPNPNATVLTCTGKEPDDGGRHRVYDFMETVLVASRGGPNVRDRPRIGRPRGPQQVGYLLADRLDGMAECWKWASARGSTLTAVTVATTIDTHGRTANTTVGPSRTDLGECLAAQLDGALVEVAAARPTRVTFPVELVKATQPAWPKPPPRPAAGKHLPSDACGYIVTDGSEDRLALSVPVILSDYDIRREPRPLPTVRVGCSTYAPRLDKAEHRAAILANRGAFATCFAIAREVDATLAGTTSIHVTFGPAGQVTAASTDGAGDERFHHCMTLAAKALWLPPQQGRVSVNFPFVLSDEETEPMRDIAREIAQLRAQGTCAALAEIVDLSATELAPWLDDDRVRGPIKELVARAKTMPNADGRACLASVEGVLQRFAMPGYSVGHWTWLDRLDVIAPVLDRVAFGDKAALAYARELLPTTRRAEGLAILDKLISREPMLDPKMREHYEWTKEAAAGIKFDHCGMSGY